MAMQKSLFHKDSRHLTTANAYVSGRRGRRPLQGWRVRFRCRVAISNTPINQNLKPLNWELAGPLSRVPRQLPRRGSLIKPLPVGEVAALADGEGR